MQSPPVKRPAVVEVEAPARLHLGFVDLHGGLGRRFVSLGVALAGIETVVVAERAARITASGAHAARAEAAARRVQSACRLEGGAHLRVVRAIPQHVGLGSGTQLALAAGTAVAALHGVQPCAEALAACAGRGARSGVGVGAFERGGFVVDGGRGEGTRVPPVISRLPFPEHWRFLLVFDDGVQGLNGKREIRAFDALAPMPERIAGEIARRVLVQLLPALAECDLDAFGEALGLVQRRVGDHFAPLQGGRYTSADVAEVMSWLGGAGITGLGQSSWGPTGFAVLGCEADAEALAGEARRRWQVHPNLRFVVCRGRNRGARVERRELRPEVGARPVHA